MSVRSARVAVALLGAAMAAYAFPAAAQVEKFTDAIAGKAFFYSLQYIAENAGLYKAEGLEAEDVNVSSGTRQAAAVIGGSADIGQFSFPHVIDAVTRGGDLVAIATAYDAYPIAVVLSDAAIKKVGITEGMSVDEKVKRMHGLRIGITSPGASTDLLVRTLFLARGLNPDDEVRLLPIGIGAPMVAALQQGSIDGFAFSAPFTTMAVNQGIGQIVIDPMRGDVPEFKDVPYQIIATSRAALKDRGAKLMAIVRAQAKAMKLTQDDPAAARRAVRQSLPEMDENAFNAAFDEFVKGIPKTPVISTAQVTNTVRMMNLTEKPPLNPTYADVVDSDIARAAAQQVLGK